MSTVHIAIIEDSVNQQNLYKDSISEDFGGDDEFIADYFVDAPAAIEALKSKKYDAVILDLLLEGDNREEDRVSGNLVLDHIFDDNGPRLLVYVVSGTLHSLSNEHEDKLNNALLNKFDRDQETAKELLGRILNACNTGVTKLLGKKGKLDTLVNSIFFSHLSKGFDSWVELGRDTEKELLRYTLIHLLEFLELPENGADSSHKFQPAEFYIIPPIQDHVSHCDIIRYRSVLYLIVSPACDITPRYINDEEYKFNVDCLTIARIHPLQREYFDFHNIQYSSDGTRNSKKWRSFHQAHKGTSPKQMYHYLPKYLGMPESVVDFSNIQSISINDYQDESLTERMATISAPFRRDIQARFSAYYGRQGQPEGSW